MNVHKYIRCANIIHFLAFTSYLLMLGVNTFLFSSLSVLLAGPLAVFGMIFAFFIYGFSAVNCFFHLIMGITGGNCLKRYSYNFERLYISLRNRSLWYVLIIALDIFYWICFSKANPFESIASIINVALLFILICTNVLYMNKCKEHLSF